MKPIKLGSALTLKLFAGYLSGQMHLKRFADVIKGKGAKVLVEIVPSSDDPDDPKAPLHLGRVERAGIEWLIANEPAAAKALRDAILAKFPDARADLRKNVDLRSLKFHDVESGALPYIGFELGCSWDDEHGLGVLMHGTRVVQIGQADTALLEWIAEGDAKKQKKKAPAKKKSAAKKRR